MFRSAVKHAVPCTLEAFGLQLGKTNDVFETQVRLTAAPEPVKYQAFFDKVGHELSDFDDPVRRNGRLLRSDASLALALALALVSVPMPVRTPTHGATLHCAARSPDLPRGITAVRFQSPAGRADAAVAAPHRR